MTAPLTSLASIALAPSFVPAGSSSGDAQPISPSALASGELALGAWAIRAFSHVDAARYFRANSNSGAPEPGHPLMLLWTNSQRNAWLAQGRRKLFASGSLLDFRLFALRRYLMLGKGQTFRASSVASIPNGLSEADVLLLERLLALPAIRKGMEAYASPLFKDQKVAAEFTLDPDVIRAQCEEDVVAYNLVSAARSKAGYRLRFVAKHNNLDLSDLGNELLVRGLAYYYRARPTLPRLHAVNMAKSAMDGALHEALAYWTHPDRARLEATPDGWSSKIMSFEDLPPNFEEGIAYANPF